MLQVKGHPRARLTLRGQGRGRLQAYAAECYFELSEWWCAKEEGHEMGLGSVTV